MSRRSGLLSDILDIVSSLPWPVGVVLAATAFVLCKLAADRMSLQVEAHDVAALWQVATHSMYGAFARMGEWLVPPLMLLGAGASWWKRRHRVRLLDRGKQNPRDVETMSWQNFERLVGEAFRQQGYSVTETGAAGADGGVDLALERDGETTLVQCKQWRRQSVGVTTVRELYGVMTHRRATGGIIVSAGDFTDEAIGFARGSGIRLVGGKQLQALIAASIRPTHGVQV